jgi:hypothetical protein
MWHGLLHFLGVDDLSGPAYGWWSGAGSDLSELALLGAIVGLLRKHNCVVAGCWRLGRHVTAAQHWVCHRHHPDGAPTHAEVIAAHHAARIARPPKRLARTQDTGTAGNARPRGEP